MGDQTPKGLLAALEQRDDGRRSAWTGNEGDTLVPQHRQGGMGGRKSKHRLSNVVWLESDINGLIEADPAMQAEAVRRGIKISGHDDPELVEVRHAVHGLVLLRDDRQIVPVWTRIHFRCSDGAHRHVDGNEVAWWPASSAQISAEVGLSEDQVDRALRALRGGGFVESTEHRLGGNYDRTKSWRPVVLESRGVDSADSRNGACEIADRSPRIRGMFLLVRPRRRVKTGSAHARSPSRSRSRRRCGPGPR